MNIKVISLLLVFMVVASYANPAVRLLIPKKPKITKSIKKKKTFSKGTKKSLIMKRNNTVNQKRRITKLEKNLIISKNAKKIRFKGRTVVKRRVYNCSKSNISLMLQGKAPIGFDGKRINLHHLKQQQAGNLVELSATEHNKHSKVLHRYTRTSDILDRNSGYSKFRQSWWKSRASNCIARGM